MYRGAAPGTGTAATTAGGPTFEESPQYAYRSTCINEVVFHSARRRCPLCLTPPLRGQPFQAGCGVFGCLGLAPEQLIGLGQHQRVRAAELPDLAFDWQLGGADLVLDVLAAG